MENLPSVPEMYEEFPEEIPYDNEMKVVMPDDKIDKTLYHVAYIIENQLRICYVWAPNEEEVLDTLIVTEELGKWEEDEFIPMKPADIKDYIMVKVQF